MDLSAVIKNAVTASKNLKNVNACDYEKDGLIYCGKCHTPKQHRVKFPDGWVTPWVRCECEQTVIDEAEKKAKEKRRIEFINGLREECFTERKWREATFQNDIGLCDGLIERARGYIDNWGDFYERGKGLMFYGSVGVGKTYASCCVANALIDKGVPCKFTDFATISNEMQSTWDKQEYLESYDRYTLIILDDLGIERTSSYMSETVYSFINHRLGTELPMIVTTNLSKEELLNPRETTNRRIYSRLWEACVPIKVEGEDLRRQIAKNEYNEDLRKLRKNE